MANDMGIAEGLWKRTTSKCKNANEHSVANSSISELVKQRKTFDLSGMLIV
jgi:hypothetical protein